MKKSLRVLLVEDSREDALLLARELRSNGYDPEIERVETQEAMVEALKSGGWDVIISDYVLPRFSGIAALETLKKTGLDIPFIIVSGKIGEEVAVDAMKAGAHDYVMKANPRRLAQALERELRDAGVRHERKGAQRHIEAFVEGITDVLALLGSDLRMISVNKVFHKLFGESDPAGKYCYEVFRGTSQPCSSCPVEVARETNEVCRQVYIFAVNGLNRHFELTASPLRDPEGKPRQFLLLKRDVTLEKEFQAKYYQRETMASIGVLAAGVAHEINNPLAAIYGCAKGLEHRLPRLEQITQQHLYGDFDEYVGIILKECGRCREIVKNLLTFGRQPSPKFRSVSINSLVTDTLKLLKYHPRHYPYDLIHLDLDANLPLVMGDASQLKQVIFNLLLNALDAVSEGGSIRIRTYQVNGDFIGLSVEDTGCGIAPQHMANLFEPFFTTKPVGEGIGIGLSTCYNIVRVHSGEILVSSQEGEGSTFLVKLPKEVSDRAC